MTTAIKTRHGRKPANNAEIRVRIDAKTKGKAEKFFKRHGLSTSDGMRFLINRAISENDPWFAHETSSHIPNAETRKAIAEGFAEKSELMTREEFRKFLDEA